MQAKLANLTTNKVGSLALAVTGRATGGFTGSENLIISFAYNLET